MARRKPKQQLPALNNWDEVDLAIKTIAEHERAIASIELKMNADIDAAKNAAKAASDPEIAKIAAISRQIEDYAEAHRADLKSKKSLNLVFGQIGWRKSTSVSLPKDKEAYSELIALLRRVGWHDCVIQAPPTISKDMIKAHDFAEAMKLGIAVKIKDDFWIETKRDDLPTDKE